VRSSSWSVVPRLELVRSNRGARNGSGRSLWDPEEISEFVGELLTVANDMHQMLFHLVAGLSWVGRYTAL